MGRKGERGGRGRDGRVVLDIDVGPHPQIKEREREIEKTFHKDRATLTRIDLTMPHKRICKTS